MCLCTGSHSVCHVGARWCNRWSGCSWWLCLQVSLLRAWAPGNQLSFLHPGGAPQLSSCSLTTCGIEAHHYQESQLLQHVPWSTREVPQPSKTCLWGPAIPGHQWGEGQGSQVCEPHWLRMWLGRPGNYGGTLSLTTRQDFVFPRSFNEKLQTVVFKKGCQSRMLKSVLSHLG